MSDTIKVLDATKKQDVTYAVPLWLRDQQILANIKKVKGRIQPSYERRTDPIAIVCFGPSLNDTWEQVKNFKFIITCSGAHKFLLEHGIDPTALKAGGGWWAQVDVDPRKHKVQLLGQPHKDIEYLIASTCHPTMFDHLAGYDVKLWHVFDSKEEGIRMLPPNEFALTGGCDAGSRAMTVAAFLGFRDLHIFGMDGCQGNSGKHAAAHPNQPKGYSVTVYNGVEYKTTPAMLEAARQVWHELDQMPAVTATFYGEGLVQAMSRDYKPKSSEEPKNYANIIGFSKPELISAEYRALNAQLHRENLAYGVGDAKYADTVIKLKDSIKAQSILNYGAGKGMLAKALPFPIWEYDPAFPEIAASPRPADLCLCFDTLEHIEPEKLQFVLGDLQRCTKQLGYFVIHTGKSGKTLADGRNSHLIQQGQNWWRKQLSQFFTVAKILKKGPHLHVIVGKKQ